MELQSKPKSKEIRQRAWDALGSGSYWPYVGSNLVMRLITSVGMVVPVMIFIISMIVTLACCLPEDPAFLPESIPLAVIGVAAVGSILLLIPWTYIIGFGSWSGGKMALAAADRDYRFGLCVSGWGHGWKMAWTVMVQLTYITLWYFLLIVPGILKTFSYAMTKYVQIDHPDWGANRCIEESMRLMKGNRWRLFKLAFSFIGWILLSVLVAPIGLSGLAMLFLVPYPSTAFACFYRQLLVEKGPAFL